MVRPRRVSLAVLGVACTLAFATGCFTKRRTVNTGWMVGGMAGPASASNAEGGAIGGVTGKAAAAHTEDNLTAYGRGDAMLGGNTRGFAGQFALQAELGGAAFDPPHHLFARGGFTGTIERDPYTGFFAIEAPVATAGYQYHGQGTSSFSDGMHVDLGVHGGLLAAARMFAGPREIDFVADPEVGPVFILLSDILNVRVEYAAVFGHELLHVGRASVCVEVFFALCLDTRQLSTHVETATDRQMIHTSTFGVSFGAGLATGYEYSSSW